MDRATDFYIRGLPGWYTSFSLQELAEVTGLSPKHLRVWRSRGHLPGDGGDQFTSREVAEVLVRHRLTFGSIPPSQSSELGRQAAQSILWHALLNHEVVEIWGSDQDVDRWRTDFQNFSAFSAEITGLEGACSYVWRPEREDAILTTDIAAALDQSKHETHFIISLERLAAHLVERAGRALFRFEVSPNTTRSWICRLT